MKPQFASIALALLLVSAPWPATATPLGNAIAAHDSGDYGRAHALLQPLAESGSVEAQFRLATLYSLGQGRPPDHTVAARWFGQAADQDHHQAAVTLANMYLSGLGVPRDEAKAIRWFEQAAVIAEQEELEEEDCD